MQSLDEGASIGYRKSFNISGTSGPPLAPSSGSGLANRQLTNMDSSDRSRSSSLGNHAAKMREGIKLAARATAAKARAAAGGGADESTESQLQVRKSSYFS